MSPLSGVLTETWALYRRYAAHFLLIAFAIYLVTAVLVALLSLAGAFGYFLGAIRVPVTTLFTKLRKNSGRRLRIRPSTMLNAR